MKFLEPVTGYYKQSLVIIAITMMASTFRYPQLSYHVIPIQDNDAIWLETICLDHVRTSFIAMYKTLGVWGPDRSVGLLHEWNDSAEQGSEPGYSSCLWVVYGGERRDKFWYGGEKVGGDQKQEWMSETKKEARDEALNSCWA